MIDTIHFRIHDLEKNKVILNQLSTINNEGFTDVQVSAETYEAKKPSHVRAILYHDSDNLMPVTRRSSLTVPSSHYTISYAINYHQDFIDFNLSVPKYYYATNVLQYINYFDQEETATYHYLHKFFTDFFKRTLLSIPNDMDIEIRRMDMCYNQFFIDKNQALSYLDKQKEINIKFARSSKNSFRSYDTSLMYITSRYSFKIYHKGTEFQENDYRELVKNGNVKGYDLELLQHNADRILRYEMTFRNTMFNYIYKNDIIKKDIKNAFTTTLKQVAHLQTKGRNTVLDRFLNKSFSFRLASHWSHGNFQKARESNIDLLDYFNFPFDLQLFEYIYFRFWEKVKSYQLDVKINLYEISKNIDKLHEINEAKNTLRKKRKGNEQKSRLLSLALLTQHTDISNLKTVVPPRTLSRWKQELKKIGVDAYNGNTSIVSPPLDYVEYKYLFGKFHISENKIIFKNNSLTPSKQF